MSREEDLLRELEYLKEEKRVADHQWRADTSNTLRAVSERLEDIVTSQQTFQADLQEMKGSIRAVRTEVSTANIILTGNGHPEKGLVVRVDRMEQDHKSQGRWFWVMVPTALSGLITAVWHYVRHGS